MDSNFQNGNIIVQKNGQDPQPANQINIAEKAPHDLTDKIFALIVMVCGFLFCRYVFTAALGTTAFSLIMFAVSIIYLIKRGHRFQASSYLYLGIGLLSAVYFVIGANGFLKFFNLFFLIGIYALFVASVTKTDMKLFPADLLNQFCPVAFSNYPSAFTSIFSTKSDDKSKKNKHILAIFVGVIISIFLLMIIVPILVSADAIFEKLVNSLFFNIREQVVSIGIQIMFGIPVGAYIFAILYGNARKRHISHLNEPLIVRSVRRIAIAPPATIYTIMCIICAVYILFFVTQAAYFLSAFKDIRPEGFTYAEYARRGFFELCMISTLNFIIIFISNIIIKRDISGKRGKTLVVFSSIFGMLTLFFIIIALSKMVLYIEAYGFTQLRLYTSWFMIMLAVISILLIARQAFRFNVLKTVLTVFAASFMLLCYGNSDRLIAQYNINAYRGGELKTLDTEAFIGLSDDAYPVIVKYYADCKDSGNKEMEQKLFKIIQYRYGDKNVEFNLWYFTVNANEAVNSVQKYADEIYIKKE